MDELNIRHYMRMAYGEAAHHSNDTKTQNGAVLVSRIGKTSFGANHIPVDGIEQTPENKALWMIHAEHAAIADAGRFGISTEGATLVCPWSACTGCAKQIIAAGVSLVIRHAPMMRRTYGNYSENIAKADEMLRRYGVRIIDFDEPIGGVTNLMNGERWEP